MPENITINVTPQATASVDVRADNVVSYYADLAKQWAISDTLVQGLDYSSKYYATDAKNSKEHVDDVLSDAGFIAVSESITNINAVADDLTNIHAVLDNQTNIDACVANETNINACATNETNINACVNNASNINTCVTNLTAITDAPTYAEMSKQYAVGLPSEPTGGSAKYWCEITRQAYKIGQVVTSTLPISEASFHPIDGELLSASGAYADFVDYVADKYTNSTKYTALGKIGTLTDNNGVISGFSTLNALSIASPAIPTTWTSFEIRMKFTTGSDVTSQNIFFAWGDDGHKSCAVVVISGKIGLWLSKSGTTWDMTDATVYQSTNTVSANTTYWCKYSFDGVDNYIVDISTDGETYTNYINYTNSSNQMNKTQFMYLGAFWRDDWGRFDAPMLGSIDLNHFSILLDGVEVITGMQPAWATSELLWQMSATNYHQCDKYVYDSTNNTVRLPKRNTEHGELIKTGSGYISGNSYPYHYRIYSDGYCEQWWMYYSSSTINTTRDLPMPFVDTQYTVICTTNDYADLYPAGVACYPKTNSTFYCLTAADGIGYSYDCRFYACGYVDITGYEYAPKYEYLVLASSTKEPEQVVIDNVITDLNNKAGVDLANLNATGQAIIDNKSDINLSNISNTGKQAIVNWSMPDYANQIVGTAGAGAWVQCAKDSFVAVWGTDPFEVNASAKISPDKTNLYMVGFFYNDINSNTKGTSFTFPVPKGWWFEANFENGYNYRIYPLKGAM